MNAVIYFSISKEKNCKKVAESLEGDVFEIVPTDKIHKSFFTQLLVYGFKTVSNKAVKFKIDDIDFKKYDTVTLVTPVWAGRPSQYMRRFIETVPFKNKEVTLIGTSKGGYEKFFTIFKSLLDPSNKVVNEVMYVKGEQV